MAIKTIYTDDNNGTFELETFRNSFEQCSISITDTSCSHDNNFQIISLDEESLENLIEQLEDIKKSL